MILIVTIFFTDYHVTVENVNSMLAVVVFIATSPRYTSTRCSGQTHILSTHVQVVVGVVTIVVLFTTTQVTTGPGIATHVNMIFVTTASVPYLE